MLPNFPGAILDRVIQGDLFFKELGRQKREAAKGTQPTGDEPGGKGSRKGKERGREDGGGGAEAGAGAPGGAGDPSEAQEKKPYIFGNTVPAGIPESSG